MALSFIFDASKETPQSLAKKRAVAEALGGRSRGPQNVGEGLTALGEALGYRMMMADVDKGEAAGREQAAATMAPLFGAGTFPEAPSQPKPSSSSAPVDFHGDELAWTDAKPYQKALLNTIAGPESGGRYNVIYGGGRFDDFSKHPGQAVRIQTGPNAGRTSSAAGKYQFLGSTWEDQAGKLGLTDFSPANQDKAAWNLAAETYKAKTGQDLDAVLQSGDPAAIASVGKVLNPIWTSLPGGIEQGTNTDRFVSTYQRALAAGASPAEAKQVAQAAQPIQVASLDPSAGVAQATQVPPMPEEYAKTGLSPEAWARMNAPTAPGAPPKPAVPQPEAKVTPSPSQRVTAAMRDSAPMGGTVQPLSKVTGALAKANGDQPAAQAASPATQRVAQAIGAEAYRGTAIDSDMPGHAPLQPGEAGPTVQQLMQAAADPWLSEQQRAMVNTMLEQKMQSNDPIRQLQLQKLKKELGTPQKQWQKLDDDTLFDPATGETKSIGKPNDGKFRFEGNSVEAQSLNGLMDSGILTAEQAQQLGAGKTITNPADGSVMFMTPQGVFGQAAAGGPAMPVMPQGAPAPVPAPTPAPSPAPVPAPPAAPASPVPPPAPAEGQRPGMIPITSPKAQKPTEAQRNRSSNVDQAFSTITSELDRYAELVGQTGIEAKPGEDKDNLNTVRQGIMLQMKELFNLGVLNGPDLSLMERMIYDPVVDPLKEGGIANLPDQIWTGVTGGAGARAKNSVDELKRMLDNIKTSVDASVERQTPGAPPPGDGGGWKDIGNGVKIRVKQ
ncbi:hypothetical protein IG197_01825 [Aminobacter sp. SR38]|jgi:muramidase (phage lysozyme)|uniref:glycoside hydrolase family 24 protein n=1 Tax=Aminobacter sp. SR38 TaxID=2774562 RepID=UPI001781575C|nr:glycoside hydrolase family 104 protein [Aminobacter sp. SR38]QOF71856.1 hypothetical protein IG197_01825 [Aminobacter sp. SR38]